MRAFEDNCFPKLVLRIKN